MNVENNRYSFACAWGDSNSDGKPDLFVVNDFGSSQLYRNDGSGHFTHVSAEARDRRRRRRHELLLVRLRQRRPAGCLRAQHVGGRRPARLQPGAIPRPGP